MLGAELTAHLGYEELDDKLNQASNACGNNSVLDYFLFRFCRKSFAFQHGFSISRKCYHCSAPHTVTNVSVGARPKSIPNKKRYDRKVSKASLKRAISSRSDA